MKKVLLTAAAVFAFGFANAQENVIKANPLSILGGSDLVSFEHKLSDKSSIVLGAGIGGFKIGDAKYSSFGAEAQYRFYFNEALRGFYAGGQAGYTSGKVKLEGVPTFNENFELTSSTSETNFGALKVGAKGGYQWIWDSGFSLDLNLGIAYNKFNYKSSDSTFSTLKASGVLPNFGFALGYAF